MGNCSCLRENYNNNENEALNYTQQPSIEQVKAKLKELKQYEPQIIKIQAIIRSFLTRKKIHKIQQQLYSVKVNKQLQAYSSTILNFNQAKPVKNFYFGIDDLNEDSSEKIFRGTVKLESGAIYFGEWVGDKRHGKGIIIWPDGSKFEGYFINNKANKRGRLIHANGEIYEGEWKNDVAEGYGIYTHLDGTTYEGQWVKDMQHGKGKEKWADGSYFEGEYENGKKNGKGKFQWIDSSYYIGQLQDNNLHGIGKYVWSDQRYYLGDWYNNKRQGYGIFYWIDGRIYEGDFFQDQKHGFGCMKYDDQREFTGYWQNDKQHGEGKIITNNNKKEKYGVWYKGKMQRFVEQPSQEFLDKLKEFEEQAPNKRQEFLHDYCNTSDKKQITRISIPHQSGRSYNQQNQYSSRIMETASQQQSYR